MCRGGARGGRSRWQRSGWPFTSADRSFSVTWADTHSVLVNRAFVKRHWLVPLIPPTSHRATMGVLLFKCGKLTDGPVRLQVHLAPGSPIYQVHRQPNHGPLSSNFPWSLRIPALLVNDASVSRWFSFLAPQDPLKCTNQTQSMLSLTLHDWPL